MTGARNETSDLETTVELCIDACKAALVYGTPEMQTAARLLLLAAGQALAQTAPDDA